MEKRRGAIHGLVLQEPIMSRGKGGGSQSDLSNITPLHRFKFSPITDFVLENIPL